MTRFRNTLAGAAVASALLATLSLPSLAQTAAPATAPGASAPAAPGPHKHERGDRPGQRMEQRIAKLKADLKLSATQESAWTAYTAAMKPAERPARMDREAFAKLTTPQRIDKMREMRTQRNAEMDRRAEATKAFYAQLNADQQKTFDAQALRMHKGPMPHHGGWRGHHGPAPAQ